ncbi:sigma factor [Lentibacillus sp.]|uniref:sigma factor n=1 Tax=Lentibacillus sp. TaxID=1925746 RepID=UPI002B4B6BE6|nr:sigma factor [Lentibacillus sp.]HLS09188.1 sigma factor [Lentibacillus sp.]
MLCNDEWKRSSFLNIVQLYEKELFYFVEKLGLSNYYAEYFQEGVYGLWEAYKSFDSTKGDFSAWVNSKMTFRMTNYFWQNKYRFQQSQMLSNLMHSGTGNRLAVNHSYHWSKIQTKLTVNQWKWLHFHIISANPPVQERRTGSVERL